MADIHGRVGSLLEVGHFHTAGVEWQEAVEYLADSIALVHIVVYETA